jgi:hypothetical protein
MLSHPPSFCILLHTGGKLLHILCNVPFHAVRVSRILGHRHRKFLHIPYIGEKHVLLRNSLAARQHCIQLRIEYPIEYNGLTFLHLPPANRQKRNDYKEMRILSRHLYKLEIVDCA